MAEPVKTVPTHDAPTQAVALTPEQMRAMAKDVIARYPRVMAKLAQ